MKKENKKKRKKGFWKFLKQLFCSHKEWKEYRIPYQPKIFPSTRYRVCKDCGKKQWRDLYNKRWI